MKIASVFLEVLGFTMSAAVLFVVARILVPYLLSQPSTIENAAGYACILFVFVAVVSMLITLIQPLLTKKDASS